MYRWKGELCRSEEWLLVLKTVDANLDALEARVREMHPYKCPEIVAVAAHAGLADYVEWLRTNAAPPGT